ncbi:hypothetical protein B0H19DRAFT_516706 [Mycena capillaripes]|nr:hypothetical protein B0H19DRAFT_516706 [Mycena capillaripes]
MRAHSHDRAQVAGAAPRAQGRRTCGLTGPSGCCCWGGRETREGGGCACHAKEGCGECGVNSPGPRFRRYRSQSRSRLRWLRGGGGMAQCAHGCLHRRQLRIRATLRKAYCRVDREPGKGTSRPAGTRAYRAHWIRCSYYSGVQSLAIGLAVGRLLRRP